MTIKNIEPYHKRKDSMSDLPNDVVTEIRSLTTDREERIKQIQERLDLPREIAERLLEESLSP